MVSDRKYSRDYIGRKLAACAIAAAMAATAVPASIYGLPMAGGDKAAAELARQIAPKDGEYDVTKAEISEDGSSTVTIKADIAVPGCIELKAGSGKAVLDLNGHAVTVGGGGALASAGEGAGLTVTGSGTIGPEAGGRGISAGSGIEVGEGEMLLADGRVAKMGQE